MATKEQQEAAGAISIKAGEERKSFLWVRRKHKYRASLSRQAKSANREAAEPFYQGSRRAAQARGGGAILSRQAESANHFCGCGESTSIEHLYQGRRRAQIARRRSHAIKAGGELRRQEAAEPFYQGRRRAQIISAGAVRAQV